ncbi:membrane protein [Legionella nautarum]|uniref:Membrane protein n=1 Tax=Legionella nautarum TaxID=45070 RepID=A0A0W0WKH4_9GAMM|nr:ElyC/SanA/YdcF family protein [Legionella nautarum]KTD32829.1 membrane protein [Legionella nautarum]
MAIYRHLFEVILNPFFLSMLFFAVFLLGLWLMGDGLIVRGGLLFVFLLLIFFSTGWLAESLTRSLEDDYLPIMAPDPKIHWVVVLSGGQAEKESMPPNSLLSTVSIKRLIEGLRLYRQLPAAKLLLSGGGYGFEVPEANNLSQVAAWFAIPPSNIVLETGSINTADQVKAIKLLVHNEPFYLVTSALHMPRAMQLCWAQGLHPIAAPTDFTLYWNDERWAKRYLPTPQNLFYLSLAMHELLGRIWAKMHQDFK